MGLPVTPEERAEYRRLNNIRMKAYRDKTRVRKYSPRKSCLVPKKLEENKK